MTMQPRNHDIFTGESCLALAPCAGGASLTAAGGIASPAFASRAFASRAFASRAFATPRAGLSRSDSFRRAPRLSAARRRRAGFSFAEIMFAVMLLAIGFIMIAGIFPVAISQNQQTMNITQGIAIAKGAADYIQQVAANQQPPAQLSGDLFCPTPFLSGGVPYATMVSPSDDTAQADCTAYPFSARQQLGGGVYTGDPRYGWLAFIMRGTNNGAAVTAGGVRNPYAQIVVIALQCRNNSVNGGRYSTLCRADLGTATPTAVPSPYASGGSSWPSAPFLITSTPDVPHDAVNTPFNAPIVTASINQGANGINTMSLKTTYNQSPWTASEPGNTSSIPVPWAAERAFVVVSNCASNPKMNGRIFRLGVDVSDPNDTSVNTFQIDPAYDLAPNESLGSGAQVYVVGKQLTGFDAAGTPTYSDTAQDIGAYSTVIKVN
jgi:Tfp pilus assembly protein PilV